MDTSRHEPASMNAPDQAHAAKQPKRSFADRLLAPDLGKRLALRLRHLGTSLDNRIPVSDRKRSSHEYVFIISTGRTGTKFFSRFFNQQSRNVRAYHEPYPDLLDVGIDFASDRLSFDSAASQLVRARNAYLRHLDRPVYLEANNRLFSLVPVLDYVFPTCRIVHIVRDARDMTTSCLAKNWFAADDPFRRLEPCDKVGGEMRGEWPTLSRTAKLAWLWRHQNEIIRKALAGRERSMTVRFEALFTPDPPSAEFDQLTRFVGAELHANVSQIAATLRRPVNVRRRQVPSWNEWPAREREDFVRIAGEEMRRYGYDTGS